jgi:preprotein translocase subunit SecE
MSKRIYYLIVVAISACITAYLFHIDDQGNYPKSHDSIQLTISVFLFYTAFTSFIVGCMGYLFLEAYFDRREERLKNREQH